jgi:stage IV sporulation protein FB
MHLYDPTPTPLDLPFRLFGVHVRVHPLFWLGMALLGWDLSQRAFTGNQLGDLLVWIACCFVSILLHEFGHVWMGWAFGSRGHIVLQGLGGLAIGSADVPYRWQRILVSAAGPGIQLLLYAALRGLIAAGLLAGIEGPELWQRVLLLALSDLLWINLAWAILNLLPIWPLDGGWIVREFCQIISSQRGLIVSLWISLITSAALAVNAFVLASTPRGQPPRVLIPYIGLYFGGLFLGIFMALFAYTAWQAIQEENARRRRFWDEEGLPWER